MPNHPNRGPKGPAANPAPDDISAARMAAGLTQRQAANLIHGTEAAWRSWESGLRRMPPGLWELFNIKTGWPLAAKGNDMTDKMSALLDSIIEANPELAENRVYLASVARGSRLMKRYGKNGGSDAPAPGPGFDEWFAGNALYVSACNQVRKIVGNVEPNITRQIVALVQ